MAFTQSSRSRLFQAVALANLLVFHLAVASTQLSFFEHSSCNAGTSFQQYSDPNALQGDVACHQTPNGTVAFYVDMVDQGCTVRAYRAADCNPSPNTVAGLMIGVGDCFFVDEGIGILSWRADCPGVDYDSTNGLDNGNSYYSGSSLGDDGPDILSALATAQGVVTFTNLIRTSTISLEAVNSATAAASTAPTSNIDETTTLSSVASTMMAATTAGGTFIATVTQSARPSASTNVASSSRAMDENAMFALGAVFMLSSFLL